MSLPFVDRRLGHGVLLVTLNLVLFEDYLDHDQAKTSDNSNPDQDEDSPHVVQPESGGRIVVVVVALDLVVQKDPGVIQIFHFAACWKKPVKMHILLTHKSLHTLVKVQYCKSHFVRPRRAFLKANPVSTPAEKIARSDEIAVASSLEFQPRAVPDECFQSTRKIGGHRLKPSLCFD